MNMMKKNIWRRCGRKVEKKVREEGEERLGKLMMVLLASGRNIDAQKAAADADYRRELYKECCV